MSSSDAGDRPKSVPASAGQSFPPPIGQGAHRREIASVYSIGLFHGLSLVAFPAAATMVMAGSALPIARRQRHLANAKPHSDA
jgi:hypothetical protein